MGLVLFLGVYWDLLLRMYMKYFRLLYIWINRGKVLVGFIEGVGWGCYSGYVLGEDEIILD